MAESKLKITQVKSAIGCTEGQRRVLQGLGLRKLNSTVIRANTPEIRGMVLKVRHLLQWEDVQSKA